MVGSYRINLYVGEEGSDQNAAGTAAIFGNSDEPAEGPNSLVNATVPLTPTLIDKNIALSPNDTVPTLENQLSWVIERTTESGTGYVEIDPSEIEDRLVISVISNEANYPEDKTQLPTKGEPVTYVAPTEGKTGGLRQGEPIPVGSRVEAVNGTSSVVARRGMLSSRRSVRLY